MKRGLNSVLPVSIGMSLDDVESIRFVFTQGAKRLIFDYPSKQAVRRAGENIIDLIWAREQTFAFAHGPAQMDTLIRLKDAETNPETNIVTVTIAPTLFLMKEIAADD